MTDSKSFGALAVLLLCAVALVGLFLYSMMGEEARPLALILAIPVVLVARAAWGRLRHDRR